MTGTLTSQVVTQYACGYRTGAVVVLWDVFVACVVGWGALIGIVAAGLVLTVAFANAIGLLIRLVGEPAARRIFDVAIIGTAVILLILVPPASAYMFLHAKPVEVAVEAPECTP